MWACLCFVGWTAIPSWGAEVADVVLTEPRPPILPEPTTALDDAAAALQLELDPGAPHTLHATVEELGWRYGLGWLQLELSVSWSLHDRREQVVPYQVVTRGLATHRIGDRRAARQLAQHPHDAQPPAEVAPMIDAAMADAIASLARRDGLQRTLSGQHGLAPGTRALIDHADPPRLGELPAELQQRLQRSGERCRTLGAVGVTAGLLLSATATGLRLTAYPEPPGPELAPIGAVGWSLVASGGALWLLGERQLNAW